MHVFCCYTIWVYLKSLNGSPKLMTNSASPITTRITVAGKELETVQQFKYLGAIINEQGSKAEIPARAAQNSVAMGKLKSIWKDQNISLQTKVKLLYSLIYAIFLYACESWTLTAELRRRIQTTELRCLRTGEQPGGGDIWDICSWKISKHCIAILTFAETRKFQRIRNKFCILIMLKKSFIWIILCPPG